MRLKPRNRSIRIKNRTALRRLSVLCLVFAACTPALPVEPTPVPTTIETAFAPQPTPSPVPEIALSFPEVFWVQHPVSHEWELIGKVLNLEDFPVESVQLTANLLEPGSSSSAPHAGSTTPTRIPPGGEAIFRIVLSERTLPGEYDLHYAASRADALAPTAVTIEVGEWRERPDGRMEILGEVENQGDHLLNLQAVHLLLYDDQDLPFGVAVSEHLLSTLPPGSSSPFTAVFETNAEVAAWEGYVEANPELLPPNAPLTISGELRLERTQQDGFFYLGEVVNEGVTPWWLVLDILYTVGDEVLGMDTMTVPFPLPPGQPIPIVIDPASLPPGEQAALEPESLDLQVNIDPWKSLPTIDPWITVPVSITQFEHISRRLYLRGEVSNTIGMPLAESAVLIRILDVHGRTRSAGWTGPLGPLDTQERTRFDLSVLVPEGLDLNLTEFDLLAFGRPSRQE